MIADQFVAESRDKHDIDDAIFLVNGAVPLHQAYEKHDLDFRYERHEIQDSVKSVFCKTKHKNICFQTVLTTLKQKLLMSG